MLLHGYHANGGCGLPGDGEGSGEKGGTITERITGKGTLSEGMIGAREKWSFSECLHIVKMVGTERARRDKDVGIGFTSIGVTVAEL